MTRYLLLVVCCVGLLVGCKASHEEGNTNPSSHTASMSITREKALEIAEADAKSAYRDLSIYNVLCKQEADGWHVTYELKDENSLGGGPHYIIDDSTGEITWKRYYQ